MEQNYEAVGLLCCTAHEIDGESYNPEDWMKDFKNPQLSFDFLVKTIDSLIAVWPETSTEIKSSLGYTEGIQLMESVPEKDLSNIALFPNIVVFHEGKTYSVKTSIEAPLPPRNRIKTSSFVSYCQDEVSMIDYSFWDSLKIAQDINLAVIGSYERASGLDLNKIHDMVLHVTAPSHQQINGVLRNIKAENMGECGGLKNYLSENSEEFEVIKEYMKKVFNVEITPHSLGSEYTWIGCETINFTSLSYLYPEGGGDSLSKILTLTASLKNKEPNTALVGECAETIMDALKQNY